MPRRLLPLVGLLLPLTLLAACSGDDGPESLAPDGAVVPAVGPPPGRLVRVETPIGRIDVTVGDPSTELPLSRDHDGVGAGHVAVPVGWRYDPVTEVAPVLVDDAAQPEPEIALVAAGESYSLDELTLRRNDDTTTYREGEPPLEFSGGAYVVVPGTAAEVHGDLAVVVSYDGLTQTLEVDDPRPDVGAAEPLYGPAARLAPRTVDCSGATTPGGVVSRDSCTVQVMDVPWYQPVGWAEPGTLWRVVTVRASSGTVERDGRTFAGDAPDVLAVTLDGAEPTTEISHGTGAGAATVVYAGAPAAAAELQVVGTVGTGLGTGVHGETATLTWRVRLLS